MAIILPQEHPAFSRLKSNGVPVKSDTGTEFAEAANRPGAITLGFVNLMPRVYLDETVDLLLTRLAQGPNDIRPIFINPEDPSKGVSWEAAKAEGLDAALVTGYAASNLPFDELSFWEDLKVILNDVREEKIPLLGVCAGAMAIANYYYGIEKHQAAHKLLGNYEYKTPEGESVYLATARHNTLNREQFLKAVNEHGLEVLAETTDTPSHPEVGVFADKENHRLLTLSHLEYAYEKSRYPGFDEPLHILDYQYQRDHKPGPKFDPVLASRVKPVVNSDLTPDQVKGREAYAEQLFNNWVADAAKLKASKELQFGFSQAYAAISASSPAASVSAQRLQIQ